MTMNGSTSMTPANVGDVHDDVMIEHANERAHLDDVCDVHDARA